MDVHLYSKVQMLDLSHTAPSACLCCAVKRRLVLVGLVIEEQPEGHGVTPIDQSTKPVHSQCHPTGMGEPLRCNKPLRSIKKGAHVGPQLQTQSH